MRFAGEVQVLVARSSPGIGAAVGLVIGTTLTVDGGRPAAGA